MGCLLPFHKVHQGVKAPAGCRYPQNLCCCCCGCISAAVECESLPWGVKMNLRCASLCLSASQHLPLSLLPGYSPQDKVIPKSTICVFLPLSKCPNQFPPSLLPTFPSGLCFCWLISGVHLLSTKSTGVQQMMGEPGLCTSAPAAVECRNVFWT